MDAQQEKLSSISDKYTKQDLDGATMKLTDTQQENFSSALDKDIYQDIDTTTMRTNEALMEFIIFPKLPAELQIKIWKYAIPLPRLVLVSVHGDVDHIRFSTKATVPGLLRACLTSRETILKVYTTCLESGDRKIRMDGDNDVLTLFTKFGHTNTWGDSVPWIYHQRMNLNHVRMFSNVKNLALADWPFRRCILPEEQCWFISQFGSLERFLPMEGSRGCDLDAENDALGLIICEKPWAASCICVSDDPLKYVVKYLKYEYTSNFQKYKSKDPDFTYPNIVPARIITLLP